MEQNLHPIIPSQRVGGWQDWRGTQPSSMRMEPGMKTQAPVRNRSNSSLSSMDQSDGKKILTLGNKCFKLLLWVLTSRASGSPLLWQLQVERILALWAFLQTASFTPVSNLPGWEGQKQNCRGYFRKGCVEIQSATVCWAALRVPGPG